MGIFDGYDRMRRELGPEPWKPPPEPHRTDWQPWAVGVAALLAGALGVWFALSF